MKQFGSINPNIFAIRNLEYKIRFCKAPLLAKTIQSLEKENVFNSYLVRGEYDIVLVGLESDSFLFKAATDKKIEDLSLQDPLVCIVDQFLKYHGCMVPPLHPNDILPSAIPEICQQLFYLSKDWNSEFVSKSEKQKLLKQKLLLVSQEGQPYEKEPPYQKQSNQQRTIVRLALSGSSASGHLSKFKKMIEKEIVRSPLVRNCYYLKSSNPFLALLEMSASPRETDDFLIHFHQLMDNRLQQARLNLHSEVVMKKISDGQMNVLASIQTKPELIDQLREKLLAPILNMDADKQAQLIQFIDRAEDAIHAVPVKHLREKFMAVVAEFQMAFYLNRNSLLEDAIRLLDREILSVMIEQFAQKLGCSAVNDAVVQQLKRKGEFKDHIATVGNLAPVFLDRFGNRKTPVEKDKDLFKRFNEFCAQTIYSVHPKEERVSAEDKKQIEDLFCGIVNVLPKYCSVR